MNFCGCSSIMSWVISSNEWRVVAVRSAQCFSSCNKRALWCPRDSSRNKTCFHEDPVWKTNKHQTADSAAAVCEDLRFFCWFLFSSMLDSASLHQIIIHHFDGSSLTDCKRAAMKQFSRIKTHWSEVMNWSLAPHQPAPHPCHPAAPPPSQKASSRSSLCRSVCQTELLH